MRPPIAAYKSQTGFTLIEMSVAITLLALITTILYGAFYLGSRAVEKTQARSEQSQRLRSADDLLAAYIRSAYPYRPSLQDPSIFFSGEQGRLAFVSALSSGMGGRGMSAITISWGEAGEGLVTLEEAIPVRPGEEAGYKNRLVLFQGVREFRIDYLDPQGAEERWVERWDGKEKKTLPRAVRLTRRERGEEVRWVFPIMMSVLKP